MAQQISHQPRSGAALPLVLFLGVLVGGNFALAKAIVLTGLSPLMLFEGQVLGAGLGLCIGLAIKSRHDFWDLLSRPVALYCLINGLLGVSAPQIMSYVALQQVSAGLFSALVTLSPLLTFCLSSLIRRELLPLRRLTGVLIGLAAVTLAMADRNRSMEAGLPFLLAAGLVPILLALTNVYREQAMPPNANPLLLAGGTLLSQAVLFLPVALVWGGGVQHLDSQAWVGPAILVVCAVTALGYILTFELLRRTDGVGFSQVGYVVTLTGIVAGALFFREPVGPVFLVSVLLLFLGVALSNANAPLFTRLFKRPQPSNKEN
eukprot:g2476.t1